LRDKSLDAILCAQTHEEIRKQLIERGNPGGMFCKKFVFGTDEKIDDMASTENRGELVHVSADDL